MRINKFLATSGVASRRGADQLILDGAVKINGRICSPGDDVDIGSDNVTVNGKPLSKWVEVYSISEYDNNGNLIHSKNSDFVECWKEYDSNGNLIHSKYSYSCEEWSEYDSNGNLIHYKNSDGKEEWNEYDSNGNLIHFKNSNGKERWCEYTYWKNGKVKTKTEYHAL